MREGARRCAGAAALVAAVALAGCGGDNGGEKSGATEPVVAKPADFPRGGKALQELTRGLGAGPVLAPSVQMLDPGRDRFGFGLFDRARKQITGVPVALYVAPASAGQVSRKAKVAGPYLARYESLAVKPAFQSKTVANDPDAARALYVADIPFRKPGYYAVIGILRLDDRLVAAAPVPVQVVKNDPVPNVGDVAPKIDTPTKASVGGVLSKIDTRVPPDTMHEVNYADVYGKRPIVLVLATPALCQSRVCGPVVDIAEQVKSEHPDDVAFIHMEIYRDNRIKPGCLEQKRPLSQCYRPQVLAFHVPTEPWLFAIDRRGRVAARLEGAFSPGELEQAVKAAVRGAPG
jgi:hypothetical protein